MARTFNFNGATKAITGLVAQTLTFPPNELDGAGVVGWLFSFEGGTDIADILRVRVYASGDLIVDVSPAFLRTWIEATARTGTTQLTTATTFFVPLYLPDLPTRDQRDACQFPVGAQPMVELDLASTAVAGSCSISWAKTDVLPRFASRLYAQSMNVAASVTNSRTPFAEGAIVRGVIHATVGVSRARLVISGRDAYRLPGPEYQGDTWGNALTITRVGESPVTIASPLFLPVSLNQPAASGASFLEMDTGAAWAGVANELGIWAVTPLAVPADGPNGNGG